MACTCSGTQDKPIGTKNEGGKPNAHGQVRKFERIFQRMEPERVLKR
jgi:hypothetical protein